MFSEERYFKRLKNYYYSLYEIEQELSVVKNQKKVTISSNEYDYLESLESRQIDQTSKIKELLDEYKNQEVI